MIEHENHCPDKGDLRCDCDYADRIRADEREKAARAIEAARDGLEYRNLFDRIMLPSIRVALDYATEVVRGGNDG